MLARRTVALMLLLALSGLVHADTIIVQQDGSGDAITIGTAVAMATAGDSILVGPGTYAESVYIDKSLHIASIMGPDQTILDGQGTMRLLHYEVSSIGTLTGLRFMNGYGDGGGAVLLLSSALSISDCVFEDNTAGYQGGAIAVGEAGILATDDCFFRGNYAPQHSGAVVVIQSSAATFNRCVFQQNGTDVSAGAIASHSSIMNVFNCLFHYNTSKDIAGAIYMYESAGQIQGNTFYHNASPGHATVVLHFSNSTSVSRCIFAGETVGFGLEFLNCSGSHACNIYWDNAAGSIYPPGLADDEIIADPLFCEPGQENFMIYDVSPAAPAHSPCGMLVGAYPVGCTGTAARDATWTAVKSLY
jgi:predicted outer membrane repeat protein